mmetsp:Transcript_18677/g.38476  ORF Transcript_18677/g.38476 Transcript_18677/m.38476 type:complete len:349 (+) Transcript_18677:684-1730(+)
MSWQPSFLSRQVSPIDSPVGAAVPFIGEEGPCVGAWLSLNVGVGVGSSVARTDSVGLSVTLGLFVFVGLSVGTDETEVELLSVELLVVGTVVGIALIVGSILPRNWVGDWLPSIDGATEEELLPTGTSVGASVGASVGCAVGMSTFEFSTDVSTYETSPTSDPRSKKIPLSTAPVMAVEYAVSKSEANSSVKSLEEFTMGTFVVTCTHKKDSGLPVGQSTSKTSTEIESPMVISSLFDGKSFRRRFRVRDANISSNRRVSINKGGSITAMASVNCSSSASGVTPLVFPSGTKARKDVSTTSLFGGNGVGSAVRVGIIGRVGTGVITGTAIVGKEVGVGVSSFFRGFTK